MKKTLILGATTNTDRYAYLAAERLTNNNYEIIPVGIKSGEVFGKEIIQSKKIPEQKIDTITLYIGAKHQPEWYDYILDSKPKRIIFNPGTENNELKKLVESKGIETVEGCTLVMLAANTY